MPKKNRARMKSRAKTPSAQVAPSASERPSSAPRKIVGLVLIGVLIANLLLVSLRVYDFLTFWIVLGLVFLCGYLFGMVRKKGA